MSAKIDVDAIIDRELNPNEINLLSVPIRALARRVGLCAEPSENGLICTLFSTHAGDHYADCGPVRKGISFPRGGVR